MRNRDVAVVACEMPVPTDVNDSREPDRDIRDFRDDGDNDTLANGTKIP